MRLVVVCGSHPRHLYVTRRILETGMVVGVVYMKREKMVDETPADLSGHLRELYEHHFKLRQDMEDKYFGNPNVYDISDDVPVLEIERDELNEPKVEMFIKKVSADCLFSYGPDLFKENILNCVDGFALNLHGGLSPWYKGDATMFWPFYFLEPNFVGTTLHYITMKIDAGNIVHQTVPILEHGDCMHEVACKAVVCAADDCYNVFRCIDQYGKPEGIKQKGNGKLFLGRDWRPEHLQVIYDLYDDKIVDMYLNGALRPKEPNLIKMQLL